MADSNPSAKIELTYWREHGLGAACRLSLAHAVGIDGFINTCVTSDEEWAAIADKYRGDSALINLPFIKFPDTPVLSQSVAVLKAIGRRFNLSGETIADQERVDEVLANMSDYNEEYVKLSYLCPKEKFPEYKADFERETIPYYFGGLDHLLGTRNVAFFGGNSVSVADFKVYANGLALTVLHGTPSVSAEFAKFPHLEAWAARMDALPSVQAFHASPMSKVRWNGNEAHWDPAV